MNYYVYINGQHARSFHTEDEGKQWVLAQIANWRRNGAKGHPEYKLCWNGQTSATLVTWLASTFAELDARAAIWSVA